MKPSISHTQHLLDYGIHIPSQTIFLTGEVNDDMYERLVQGILLIESQHGENTDLKIELNSPGGDWYAGIAIHDRLVAIKYPVTIRVSGMAMSMGSVILQAADHRLVTPGSTIMIHDGSDVLEGRPEDIMAWASHSRSICDYMYKIYSDASGKPVTFWKKKCKGDYILSAAMAIKLGLADGFIK